MRNQGLTLTEILISVLMLGIGMVGVAGLFPAAGHIQRKTYDDMVTKQVSESVRALITSRGFSINDLLTEADGTAKQIENDPTDPLGWRSHVRAVRRDVLNGGEVDVEGATKGPKKALNVKTTTEWHYVDRSFLTHVPKEDRPYVWVPLVRRPNALEWEVYAFVVRKNEFEYPKESSNTQKNWYVDSANPDDWRYNVPPIIHVKANWQGSVTDSVTGQEFQILKIPASEFNGKFKGHKLFDDGDQVLDSQGTIRTIDTLEKEDTGALFLTVDGNKDTDINGLWLSIPSPRTGSPTRKILSFRTGVIQELGLGVLGGN